MLGRSSKKKSHIKRNKIVIVLYIKSYICKNMQATYANKEEPIILVRFPFFSLAPEYFRRTVRNFFNIMHNLKKLYALKKANKTILYIFTHCLIVCVAFRIEVVSRSSRACKIKWESNRTTKRPFSNKVSYIVTSVCHFFHLFPLLAPFGIHANS